MWYTVQYGLALPLCGNLCTCTHSKVMHTAARDTVQYTVQGDGARRGLDGARAREVDAHNPQWQRNASHWNTSQLNLRLSLRSGYPQPLHHPLPSQTPTSTLNLLAISLSIARRSTPQPHSRSRHTNSNSKPAATLAVNSEWTPLSGEAKGLVRDSIQGETLIA